MLKGHCTTCGKLFGNSNHHKKDPYPVTLCPGACFGYFQTQWRKWEEVCPYPYIGRGLSDAPRPTGTLPPPRPFDPNVIPDTKKTGSADLPQIPIVTNKFGN
jgi:hypothetical protein